jgi:hypothetical protein
MATTLLTAGIACIVAAIVGGGLKAFGLEIPALASSRRQIGLGLFGAALLAAAAVASRDGFLSRGESPVADQAERTADGAPAAPSSSDCFASTLGAVPADRLKRVESGTAAFDIVTPDQRKDLPIAVVIEERRRPVGAIEFDFFAGSDIFKISRVIDADCRQVTTFRNSARGGVKTDLQNWDEVEMTLGASTYSLRLGYSSGTISGSLTSVIP